MEETILETYSTFINYIINDQQTYILDDDDRSSSILLEIVTNWGSPGNENLQTFMKKQTLNKIKTLNYRRVKIQDLGECPICLDQLSPGEYYRTLECSHCFHKKCIDRWFKKDHTDCPMCRKKILN
jgi:hypothetical protein